MIWDKAHVGERETSREGRGIMVRLRDGSKQGKETFQKTVIRENTISMQRDHIMSTDVQVASDVVNLMIAGLSGERLHLRSPLLQKYPWQRLMNSEPVRWGATVSHNKRDLQSVSEQLYCIVKYL